MILKMCKILFDSINIQTIFNKFFFYFAEKAMIFNIVKYNANLTI